MGSVTTLLIARHGNTFDLGETILRVGKRTDLPLSRSGIEQAKRLGVFLNQHYPVIDRVLVSQLQRTQQTARYALAHHPLEVHPFLDEIDYGIDDGKPESAVIARVGARALKAWEEKGIPPADWPVDPEMIIQGWKVFAESQAKQGGVALLVTSNGIARFAPSLLADPSPIVSLKMNTGAISAFECVGNEWRLLYWNMSVKQEDSSVC